MASTSETSLRNNSESKLLADWQNYPVWRHRRQVLVVACRYKTIPRRYKGKFAIYENEGTPYEKRPHIHISDDANKR